MNKEEFLKRVDVIEKQIKDNPQNKIFVGKNILDKKLTDLVKEILGKKEIKE